MLGNFFNSDLVDGELFFHDDDSLIELLNFFLQAFDEFGLLVQVVIFVEGQFVLRGFISLIHSS